MIVLGTGAQTIDGSRHRFAGFARSGRREGMY